MPITLIFLLIALVINSLGVLFPVHFLLQAVGGFVSIYLLQSSLIRQNIKHYNYLLYSCASGLLVSVITSYLYILNFTVEKNYIFKSIFLETDLLAQALNSHQYKFLIFIIIFFVYYIFYCLGCWFAFIIKTGTPVKDKEFLSKMSVSELSDFLDT